MILTLGIIDPISPVRPQVGYKYIIDPYVMTEEVLYLT